MARLRKVGPCKDLAIKNNQFVISKLAEYSVNKHCKITRTNGKYFLAVTKEIVVPIPLNNLHSIGRRDSVSSGENQALQPLKLCAIDPGVRTFATAFSDDKVSIIGKGFNSKLKPLTRKIDKLQRKYDKLYNTYLNLFNAQHTDKELYSQIPQWVHDKLRYYKKRSERLQLRKRNLVKDLHYKTAHYLISSYDLIMLPTFETQAMVQNKVQRPDKGSTVKAWQKYMRRLTNRSMMNLSHYKFKEILRWMCKKYGKMVLDCSESYTSKIRSWDGILNENLTSEETVTDGNISVNRDINGARNIYLKTIQELCKLQGFGMKVVA